MRLLLIEDDPLLGEGLSMALQQEGYAVNWLKRAKPALAALQMESYSVIILDLGLPDLDGLDLLKQIRASNSKIPVLILTARDQISDRVNGLDRGADDYLSKPFDLDELNARLRALIRRSRGEARSVLSYRDLILDPKTHQVYRSGQQVLLSKKEFILLHYLLLHRHQVISAERLQEQLYNWHSEPESNALQVHIYHLRKKIGKDMIQTVRGLGYQIA